MNRENDESTFLRGWRGSINIWRRSKKKWCRSNNSRGSNIGGGSKKQCELKFLRESKKKLRGFKCLARI